MRLRRDPATRLLRLRHACLRAAADLEARGEHVAADSTRGAATYLTIAIDQVSEHGGDKP